MTTFGMHRFIGAGYDLAYRQAGKLGHSKNSKKGLDNQF